MFVRLHHATAALLLVCFFSERRASASLGVIRSWQNNQNHSGVAKSAGQLFVGLPDAAAAETSVPAHDDLKAGDPSTRHRQKCLTYFVCYYPGTAYCKKQTREPFSPKLLHDWPTAVPPGTKFSCDARFGVQLREGFILAHSQHAWNRDS